MIFLSAKKALIGEIKQHKHKNCAKVSEMGFSDEVVSLFFCVFTFLPCCNVYCLRKSYLGSSFVPCTNAIRRPQSDSNTQV